MHTLPFGAKLTDALFRILRDAATRCLPEHPDFVPNLCWLTTFQDGQPREHWGIGAFSRTYMRDQDMFTVDGITFCVASDDQARARGHILDWQTGVGVVQIDPPKT
jgi:hypothetical protein